MTAGPFLQAINTDKENKMKKPGLDMTIHDTDKYNIDVGYGQIEIVNGKVCNYIWRLRQVIKDAGLSENPRQNHEKALKQAEGTNGAGI